jgi:hypothetical protein
VRRPWQWADEERIAARLDPAYIAKHSKPGPSEAAKVTFSIDGRENPHLFLPFELFNSLMDGLSADAGFRDTRRAMLHDRIKDFGYDPNAFWAELETSVASHLKSLRRNAALRERMRTASRAERDAIARDLESSNIPVCRSRAESLAAARAHFGRETFDRFLYSVVAPQLSVSSPMPGAEEGRGLAYIQGGCR